MLFYIGRSENFQKIVYIPFHLDVRIIIYSEWQLNHNSLQQSRVNLTTFGKFYHTETYLKNQLKIILNIIFFFTESSR